MSVNKVIVAVVFTAAMFFSCSSEQEDFIGNPIDGAEVTIGFVNSDQFNTRSFFDDTGEAKAWEKKINRVLIYVFDEEGEQIMRKQLTMSEIVANEGKVYLPAKYIGTTCSFYAAVNADNPQIKITKEQSILDCFNISVTDYSNEFHKITTSARPLLGFAMSGVAKAEIEPNTAPTEVLIVLKRPIAKCLIQTTIDPLFSAKYGGKIISLTLSFNNMKSHSSLFENPNYRYAHRISGLKQKSNRVGDVFQNLFYLAESKKTEESERMAFLITATYDHDGSDSTMDDRVEVEWLVKLEGSGGGQIKRNTLYKLDLKLNELNAVGISAKLQITEWGSPETQSYELTKDNQL